jgi:hypothetical protein
VESLLEAEQNQQSECAVYRGVRCELPSDGHSAHTGPGLSRRHSAIPTLSFLGPSLALAPRTTNHLTNHDHEPPLFSGIPPNQTAIGLSKGPKGRRVSTARVDGACRRRVSESSPFFFLLTSYLRKIESRVDEAEIREMAFTCFVPLVI